ncbi:MULTISPECIES: EAL domain-containing protein [Aliiroseovarius]|uniref:EAL domain-containing protein n=1 Tax=Aliiroseovarius TaxID=1658781 RepID=UPI00156A3F43|nr:MULTISPECIES: EAL domain-containing protein [Aliiroseovarius]UWP97984.1 EAL domain-containing protein [Aliiroseovarius crassostreae]UWQ04291.1 EAL domain-containing protein [Aliiroseovarius crassostreae]
MNKKVKSSPFDIAVQKRQSETLDMVRIALAHKQVKLAFQPVVLTAQPDRMAFYEGLLRVTDQQGRVIPAKDFIDVVEETDMGRQLDALAIEQGLMALAEEPGLRLSINMSANTIGYAPWNEALLAGLSKDPTLAERLIIEITERTALCKSDDLLDFMTEMQGKGISFALDDFGAGYTSFKYLKDFYFDLLKIDGELIHGVHKDPDAQLLTEALLDLAHKFEMFVVAENVETFEDAEYLSSIGMDCMQGYYFGVPTLTPYWRVNQILGKTA